MKIIRHKLLTQFCLSLCTMLFSLVNNSAKHAKCPKLSVRTLTLVWTNQHVLIRSSPVILLIN